MDVRIGLADAPRELGIELAEGASADDVKAQIEAGIAAGSMVWITDKKGHQVGFRADKVTFVDVGTESGPKMGFG